MIKQLLALTALNVAPCALSSLPAAAAVWTAPTAAPAAATVPFDSDAELDYDPVEKDEVFPAVISLVKQTCKRARQDEVFVCSSSTPDEARVAVSLQPAKVSPAIEEAAAEGSSPFTHLSAMNFPRYISQVSIRKSIAMSGRSVIYTLRFTASQEVTRSLTPGFETVFISADKLHVREPILLMGDRFGDDLKFTQFMFTLMPVAQFGR